MSTSTQCLTSLTELKQHHPFRRKGGAWFVLAGMAVYILLLCWTCYAKFSAYGYADFDLAVHAQSVWNIVHGSLDSSILGIPFLGNHMVLILFLIAPLYTLFPTPLALLYVQTVILAAGAWGVYLLGRKELSTSWGAAFALVYLVYPPLIYMNLYEFHPVALATCFLLYVFYFYKTDQFRWFLLFLILALFCQENVALIAFFFGIYALAERKTMRWVLLPLSAGSVYFFFMVLVLMPRLNNNTIQFFLIYEHLGSSLSEIVGNITAHPVRTLSTMCGPQKLIFLNSLLAPLGFLSLLSPFSLLPLLPVFLQRMLSLRECETMVFFHYQAEFIPFIFVSAIYGARRVLRFRQRLGTLGLVIVLSVFPLAAVWFGGIVPSLSYHLKSALHPSALRDYKDMLVNQIPPDASTAASFQFLAKLSGRKHLYSLPHIYCGRYVLSRKPYHVPADLEYIIFDTNDRLTFFSRAFYAPGYYTNLQALLNKGNWQVVENIETLILLSRRKERGGAPFNILRCVDQVEGLNTNIYQYSAQQTSIRLLGFELGHPESGCVVPLTLYWKKDYESDQDYDTYVLVADKHLLYAGMLSPGTRIWPPQSWPTNTLIADRHHIVLQNKTSHSDTVLLRVELIPLRQ